MDVYMHLFVHFSPEMVPVAVWHHKIYDNTIIEELRNQEAFRNLVKMPQTPIYEEK